MVRAVFACSAISFMSSASFGEEASYVWFFPVHLKDGIFSPVVHPVQVRMPFYRDQEPLNRVVSNKGGETTPIS